MVKAVLEVVAGAILITGCVAVAFFVVVLIISILQWRS